MAVEGKVIQFVRPIEAPVVHEQPRSAKTSVPAPRIAEQDARGAVAFRSRVDASRFADPREGRVLSALEGTSVEQLQEGRHTFVSGAELFMRAEPGRIS